MTIRERVEEIKNKPHGADVDFLIQTIESLLNDTAKEKKTSRENTFDSSKNYRET